MKNLYLAGLFDGEGHISIYTHTDKALARGWIHTPVIKLGLTKGQEIVREYQVRFGGTFYLRKYQNNHADLLIWTLRGRDNITKFLDEIGTHLILKREQADIVREYYEGFKAQVCKEIPPEEMIRRNTLQAKIKALNLRGKPLAETK